MYHNIVLDSKIRLFSYATGKVYYGLLPYIQEYCKKNNIYIVEDGIDKYEKIDIGKVKQFCNALKTKLGFRDYQLDAIQHCISNHRSICLSPTSSSKSLIIYALLRYYLLEIKEQKRNIILIIVHTTSVVEQLD